MAGIPRNARNDKRGVKAELQDSSLYPYLSFRPQGGISKAMAGIPRGARNDKHGVKAALQYSFAMPLLVIPTAGRNL